jgi:hypothetical protein
MAFKRNTGQQFACKIVDLLAVKQKLQRLKKAKILDRPVEQVFREKVELYLREATILQRLQHVCYLLPSVMRFRFLLPSFELLSSSPPCS